MAARIFAIGDIHGCAAALDALLAEIAPTSDDLIVTLGDYIDRGPESPRVVERLLELQQQCQLVPLLGNHEAMLLMALKEESELGFWLECGGQETLDAYGGKLESIPLEHVEFLLNCHLYAELDKHFFVHANYTPSLPLDKQPEYVLLWEHLTMHMPAPHMSGKKAVVGHTPQRDGEILVTDHLICIDTFCYGPQGWLTALDVEAELAIQANRNGELRRRI